MKQLKLGLILMALGWLVGCSAGTLAPDNSGVESAVLGASGDPSAAGFDATKSVSTTYTYFFRDHVNDASAANWTVINNNGNKQWVLSTANYFSSPRAWIGSIECRRSAGLLLLSPQQHYRTNCQECRPQVICKLHSVSCIIHYC